jgi:hypothetical protein
MDLPCDDESAGLTEYTDTVVQAIGDHTELVLVAQSFGAFTAPLVCKRVPVELMVLVAGMVPVPGERGEDWFARTGYEQAAREQHADDESEIAEDATRRTPRGWSRGRWTSGPTCRPGICCVVTTASSRPSGCAASSVSGSASPPTRSMAATALPSVAHGSWPSV